MTFVYYHAFWNSLRLLFWDEEMHFFILDKNKYTFTEMTIVKGRGLLMHLSFGSQNSEVPRIMKSHHHKRKLKVNSSFPCSDKFCFVFFPPQAPPLLTGVFWNPLIWGFKSTLFCR